MNELIDTERVYVEELQSIIEGYSAVIDNPEFSNLVPTALQNKNEVLFGNLGEIYEFHNRTFLKELENCIENPELVGTCFLKRKEDLQIYEKYCQNKPRSEALWRQCGDSQFFQECQRKLDHKLSLDAYLLKPVQRITKYQLMLKEMLKCSKNSEGTAELEEALASMLDIIKSVNDSMHQIAITGFEAVTVMEVPFVKIKGGEPGSESGNTFIKTIVNMEIKVPCIKTCNVKEFGDGEKTEFETIFILTDFGCPEYEYLYKKDNRILGPPVVLHCAAKEEPLPFSSRPLYCTTMLNLVLCFTGFRKKEEVVKLVNLAHHMGGTIRRDFSSKVTHLIANSTHGEKFRVAVSMGTPILKTEWIYKAWEKRNEPNFCAAAEDFRLEFKVPPFQDCVLSFLGFSDEDKASMEDITEMQDYTPHRVVTRSRKICSRTPGNLRPTRHSQRWRNERAKQNIPEKEGQLEIDFQQRSGVSKASVYLLQAKQEQMQLQDSNFCAAAEEFRLEYKVPPFQDCVLSFLGFSDEDKASMEDMTEMQGGRYLPVGDVRCTHMVVEENTIKELPFEPSKKLYVVKQEAGSPTLKKSVSLLSLNTPNSNRKKRRLQDTLAQLTRETDISPFPPRKRTSAEHSLSMGSLLDISNTPESGKATGETPRSIARPSKSSTPVPQKQSARWQVAKELYQTESNYVDILTTVLQLFKDPLEKEGQLGGPILAVEEIKTIFGSIPDIFDVHTRIKTKCLYQRMAYVGVSFNSDFEFEAWGKFHNLFGEAHILCFIYLQAELEELVLNWSEDKSVGDIILKYSKELVKAYPPFVNFFEMSKETIAKCEKQKPRFHAFLKINQAKPECGRQTLAELLIRPVQRLPSVALLLNGNLKLFSLTLCGLMSDQVRHRNFPFPVQCRTLSDIIKKTQKTDIRKHTAEDNPDKVTLEKAIESLKEVMMHINEDKRKTEGQKQIFDVVYEVDNCPANLLSSHRSLVHRVETISLGDKPCDRGENVTLFLFNDCLEENLIQRTDPDSLQVNTKDMDSSTLSRASRAIKKTSKKVTRAFSFTKTPKRVIQRAFLANGTPDSPTSDTGNYLGGRLASTSSLAISRSSSTFSLNCSARHANVHRSNSLDASSPSSRLRAPICTETPSSPKKHIGNNRVSTSVTSNASPTAQISSVPTITTAFDPSEQSLLSVSPPQRSSLVTRRETLL
ncbi:UNVERIFIED_CONTAM: hypothetical protein FKN15_044060 [Acipenser sinensis]